MRRLKNNKKLTFSVGVLVIIIAIFGIWYAYSHRQFEYTELEDGTLEVIRYMGKNTEVHIPSTAYGKKVTSINWKYGIWTRVRITLVEIPDTVTHIGDSAFSNCKNLVLKGGDNVEEIGANAFGSCYFPEGFPVWNNLKRIGKGAFKNATGIENLVLGNKVEYIAKWAFYSSDLTNLTIPETLTFVGYQAFDSTPYGDNMEGYTTVNDDILIYFPIRDKVIVPVGTRLISNCKVYEEEMVIKEFYIPDSVTMIEENMLYGTNGIRIYIPSSVVQIGGFEDENYGRDLLYHEENADMTLIVESGSYAESYAIEKGIKYEIVDSVQTLYELACFTPSDGDFEYITSSDDTTTVVKYIGTSADVAFPTAINGTPSYAIGNGTDDVFTDKDITEISIPDTVSLIAPKVFWDTLLQNS